MATQRNTNYATDAKCEQIVYARGRFDCETTQNVMNCIMNDQTLEAIATIGDQVLQFGYSDTAELINNLIESIYANISIENIVSTQTCIYLLSMKHQGIINIVQFSQLCSLINLSVFDDQYFMYTDIITYYDENPDKLSSLSYLFEQT